MVNMITFLIHKTKSTFENLKKYFLQRFLNLILKMLLDGKKKLSV